MASIGPRHQAAACLRAVVPNQAAVVAAVVPHQAAVVAVVVPNQAVVVAAVVPSQAAVVVVVAALAVVAPRSYRKTESQDQDQPHN